MINNNPASFPYLSTLIEKRQLCVHWPKFVSTIWNMRSSHLKNQTHLSFQHKQNAIVFVPTLLRNSVRLCRVDIHTKYCKKFKKCAIFGGHIAQFAIVNQRFLMNFFWINEVQFVRKCFHSKIFRTFFFLNFFRVLCNLGSNHKINL